MQQGQRAGLQLPEQLAAARSLVLTCSAHQTACCRAGKGGTDPDGLGASVIAADILWSDPGSELGLTTNDARGVGLVFGPDVTQARISCVSSCKAAVTAVLWCGSDSPAALQNLWKDGSGWLSLARMGTKRTCRLTRA